ncbi:tetratricopeptide repeat protein [Streptomyces sp. NPDC002785]|uniref:tetratricopeptide repeat protein n=1 Tax=Streptomyces sp. NPDC002785 TaxID=3154543 RepID=UPI00332075CD
MNNNTLNGPAFIQVGDHNTQHVQFAVGPLPPVEEMPAAAGPVGVSTHVPLFVGRGPELARLEQALAAGPGAVVQAVHGLGGIGKSALAARYVALHADRYSQVVWITAEDAAGIEAGLRRFALALEPQLAALPSEALAERATLWLAAHRGWLLVLDNVTSPKVISALLGRLRGAGGRFLATSRRSNGWNQIGATPVPLDVLEPDEALTLLAETIGATPGALDGGAELCAELGFLPLALTQAGVYIAQNQPGDEPTAREYLQRLADHPAHMYATGDEDTDSGRVIARTWNITLDRFDGTPLAGQILRILAWYAPDQIPVSLLDPLAPQPGLGEAIGKLVAYNMLTREPADPQNGPHLKVHRLVQAVTRTPDPTGPHRDPVLIAHARDQATTMLHKAVPGDSSAWNQWRRVIAHIRALADNTHRNPAADNVETASLLQRAVFYLSEESTRAEEEEVWHVMRAYSDRVVTAYERILGPRDKTTLAARRQSAWFVEDTDTVKKVSADLERVLGADDSAFLVSLHDQAWRHLHREEFVAAENIFRRALASQQQLPAERDNELATQYGLGFSLFRQKRFSEAAEVLADCVRRRTAGLSPLHPHTLITKRMLGETLLCQGGRIEEALGMLRETLEAQQSIFREGHSEIKETQAWEARATAEQAVETLRRLSADNPAAHKPGLATALSGLAAQRLKVGWWREEALAPAEEAVEIYRQLAADDPTDYEGGLATALHAWAWVRYQARQDSSGALQATGEAIEIFRKLVAATPERFLSPLCAVLDLQVDLLFRLGRMREARDIRDWLAANGAGRINE